MNTPLVLPRIVIIGLVVMVFAAILATAAYYFEVRVLSLETGERPLFELFADAFKVGLGAFIGVLSQWATQVFERGTPGERASAQKSVADRAAAVEAGAEARLSH